MKKAPSETTTSATPPTATPKKPAAKKKVSSSAPKKTAPRTPATNPRDPQRRQIEAIRDMLEAKKGENIVILNVADVSSVTDYMILCSGLNTPHLRALADDVAKQLHLADPPRACHRRAGSPQSEWLVLDYIDFVIHLFTPVMRSYYALEQLWKDAPVVG
ncbi:MAG: ribosome silencing factor [Kiritimatiellae bacterium]|nr:ribosome silencing factor [Kiritimatiellia bacterium]